MEAGKYLRDNDQCNSQIVGETMPVHPAHPCSQPGNAIAQIKTSEYFSLLPGLRRPHSGNYPLPVGWSDTNDKETSSPVCPPGTGGCWHPGQGWQLKYPGVLNVLGRPSLPYFLPALPHVWALATLKQTHRSDKKKGISLGFESQVRVPVAL